VDTGKIVYSIMMAGAAVFKKDAADADQAVAKLGDSAEKSASKVSKAGTETDKLGKAAKDSKAPLDEQAKSTKKVGDDSDDAKKKVKGLGDESLTLKQSMTMLGAAALGVGAAIALVGGLAVSTYSEFDAAMSRTSAATLASAADQKALGDAAVEAGADTVYSAREAADAETELAKAGLSVKNILSGGLTGSLALAAAGQLDVARAAEIAAVTLKQFNLSGDQTGHVADVLAAGAGKAVGSVNDLAQGLKFVGPVANAMGISLEETVGVMSLFADQGIIGEQAGTAFRGMLLSLTSPSSAARKEIERLGINLYDGQGKFLGMQNAADQLQTGLRGLTDEQRDASLGIIFGNEQVTAARVLYKEGATGVAEYTDAVSESGYAADQAARMTDNLQGDIERLGGAFDSALIQTGEGANDALRTMVQLVTSLVDWYGQLPGPVQASALYLGAAAAAVFLLGGALLIAVPRIVEFRAAISTLNTEMPRATGAVKGMIGFLGGPWGAVITAATVVLGIFIGKQADAAAKADSYKASLDSVTGAITDQTRAATAANLAAKGDWFSVYGDDSAADSAKKLKISLESVTDAVYGNADAMKEIQDVYDLFYSSGPDKADERAQYARDLGLSANDASKAVANLYNEVKAEQSAISDGQDTKKDEIELNGKIASSTDTNSASTQTSAAAYLEAADGANSLLDELTQLIDLVNKANEVGQDAVSSNIDYKNSLADLDDVIQKARDGVDANNDGVADYTLTLDENTQAGRDNMDALVGIASAGQKAADAQFNATHNTEEYKAALDATHQAVYDRAIALGANADQAQAIADNIAGIPSDTEWKMVTETAQAAAEIQRIKDLLNSVPTYRQTSIGVTVDSPVYNPSFDPLKKANGGKVNFYASGGYEQHVAQFARAGTVRVWAEPETGGEYYVPMAPEKRPRSLAIARAMTAEMGYAMVPFEDGGRFGAGGSVAGGGDLHQHFEISPIQMPDWRAGSEIIGRAAARKSGGVR